MKAIHLHAFFGVFLKKLSFFTVFSHFSPQRPFSFSQRDRSNVTPPFNGRSWTWFTRRQRPIMLSYSYLLVSRKSAALLMSQLSLEVICLPFCRDTALEILALRQQGGGFLPCLTTKILRIYSSRFNWYINRTIPIAAHSAHPNS